MLNYIVSFIKTVIKAFYHYRIKHNNYQQKLIDDYTMQNGLHIIKLVNKGVKYTDEIGIRKFHINDLFNNEICIDMFSLTNNIQYGCYNCHSGVNYKLYTIRNYYFCFHCLCVNIIPEFLIEKIFLLKYRGLNHDIIGYIIKITKLLCLDKDILNDNYLLTNYFNEEIEIIKEKMIYKNTLQNITRY